MQAAIAETIQVNTRVDAADKRAADDILALMGSSIPELIRSVIHKAGQGAEEYDRLREALREGGASTDEHLAKAQEGWNLVDSFYRSVGIDPGALPVEQRTWKEIYEEAKDEHFMEKGMLQ